MTVEVALIISTVSVAFSIYFGLKNSKRTDVKDIEERAATNTKMNMKLDEINRNTTDIKYDITAIKKDVQRHSEKLVEVESSTKQAHHRIDGMEERMLNCNKNKGANNNE